MLLLFDISRYLTDKYFDIVWGATSPLGTPHIDPPKINFLNGLIIRVPAEFSPVCFDISKYLTDKYFDIVWGCHFPGDPQMDPQKSIF